MLKAGTGQALGKQPPCQHGHGAARHERHQHRPIDASLPERRRGTPEERYFAVGEPWNYKPSETCFFMYLSKLSI
jgi:hypothetical protein